MLKTSAGKETWAGEKQVYRLRDEFGRYQEDVLAQRREPPPPGSEPLLHTVMRNGRRVAPSPTLATIREHCRSSVAALPEDVRRLENPAVYPVLYSPALRALQAALRKETLAVEVVGPFTLASPPSGERSVGAWNWE